MVEMMLMQNAQMHQIMMQNMMLKALPPALLTQLGGVMAPLPQQVTNNAQPGGNGSSPWEGTRPGKNTQRESWESQSTGEDTAP